MASNQQVKRRPGSSGGGGGGGSAAPEGPAGGVLGGTYPNPTFVGPYFKDYARATLTAGDVTLNATAVTAVSSATDLTLTAATGDLIVYHISGLLSAAAAAKGFDVYTFPGDVQTNPFGPGLSASLANVAGVPGWRCYATATEVVLTGSFPRILVSGDIAGGEVKLRLYYAGLNTTARSLFAQANYPFNVWAFNLGPTA